MRSLAAALVVSLVATATLARPCTTVTLPEGDTTVGEAYASIAEQAGARLLFDGDVRRDEALALDGSSLCVDEALALLELGAGTFQVAPLEGTWLVAPDNQTSRRRHEPMVVRSFVLEHVSVREANALLRGVVDVRKTAVDERANQITIRDGAERVELAARVLESMDHPRGRVEVEAVIARVPKDSLHTFRRDRSERSIAPTRAVESLLGGERVLVIADPVLGIASGDTERLALTDDVVSGGAVHRTGFDATVRAELHPTDELVTLDAEIELSAVPAGGANVTRRSLSSSVRLAPGESWVVAGLASAGGRGAALSSALADLARGAGGAAETELVIVLTPRVLSGTPVGPREIDLVVGTESHLRLR